MVIAFDRVFRGISSIKSCSYKTNDKPHLPHICWHKDSIKSDDHSFHKTFVFNQVEQPGCQSLLDQVVSFCGQEIKIKELSELLGIIDQELFFESSDCISDKDVVVGLQLVEKIFNHGYDMAEFLNGLAEHFRNMLIVRATDNLDLLEGMETYGEKYKEAARGFDFQEFFEVLCSHRFRLLQPAFLALFQQVRLERF